MTQEDASGLFDNPDSTVSPTAASTGFPTSVPTAENTGGASKSSNQPTAELTHENTSPGSPTTAASSLTSLTFVPTQETTQEDISELIDAPDSTLTPSTGATHLPTSPPTIDSTTSASSSTTSSPTIFASEENTQENVWTALPVYEDMDNTSYPTSSASGSPASLPTMAPSIFSSLANVATEVTKEESILTSPPFFDDYKTTDPTSETTEVPTSPPTMGSSAGSTSWTGSPTMATTEETTQEDALPLLDDPDRTTSVPTEETAQENISALTGGPAETFSPSAGATGSPTTLQTMESTSASSTSEESISTSTPSFETIYPTALDSSTVVDSVHSSLPESLNTGIPTEAPNETPLDSPTSVPVVTPTAPTKSPTASPHADVMPTVLILDEQTKTPSVQTDGEEEVHLGDETAATSTTSPSADQTIELWGSGENLDSVSGANVTASEIPTLSPTVSVGGVDGPTGSAAFTASPTFIQDREDEPPEDVITLTFHPLHSSTNKPSAHPSQAPSARPSLSPSDFPSVAPTEPAPTTRCGTTPNERRADIYTVAAAISGYEVFDDVEGPHYQAVRWLMISDDVQICASDENMVQRYVLALLYYATSGDINWRKCSQSADTPCPEGHVRFLSGTDECDWDGVTCEDGKVTHLNLDERQLHGQLPHELSALDELQEIDMDSNWLVGTIPETLGSLSKLEILDLDRNSLSGTIPESIYSAPSLRNIDLDYNSLSGSISTAIGNLSNLFFLQVDFNQFTGTIPTEVGNLPNVHYFSVLGNDFDGEIPTELCNGFVHIYANCFMCDEAGSCCTACLPGES
ncbi:receptor-like protein kinase [Seminavis robusta]|uniref:Receptor-like protein kinase n=1 Tax=Seminavis robusta TaxID=568900 RepID=A0A9N8HL51_9STRA|nr:receptor-like protein kinase [Seminavis robusta]|eukprot:Sro798_g203990.1 receptor-like protein kinase (808) ;mRNA; f:13709-16226